MKLLAFAASLRSTSWNRKLIRVAAALATEAGAVVGLADFRDFHMPIYDGDLQESSGIPPGALELGRRVEAVDGLLIASPEYNYSLPGTLKNAIDWVSRIRPMPLKGKSALLLAASNGSFGGVRGLWQLRIPLEGLGMYVYPEMFPLPRAVQAFEEDGGLKDEATRDRLRKLIASYLHMGDALKQSRSDN